MSKMCKKALTVLLAAVMFMALAAGALAADTVNVTVEKQGSTLQLTGESTSQYTDSDLFNDEFKNVMPGDAPSETITFSNKGSKAVKVYLSVKPHSEATGGAPELGGEIDPDADGTTVGGNGNPLTYDDVYENEDGKDQSNVDGRDETIASMQDFLNQLTMSIYTGTGDDKKPVAGAQDITPGVELTGQPLYLFEIPKNGSQTLTVDLEVPIEMDNRYAYRVGEVDWVFKLVEVTGGGDGPSGGDGKKVTVRKVWVGADEADLPDSITVKLLNKKGREVENVTLSKANNWTYTLKDELDWSEVKNWTMEESGSPEGYTVSTSMDNKSGTIILTVTNSKGGDGPKDPEDPNNPNNPDNPGGNTPGGGETPGGSTDTPGGSTGSALTVVKAWEDNDASKRPTAVCVTLFNGEEAVESVWLSDWNNWTYSWTELGSGLWNVIETEIPAGYTPTYANVDGVVVITNVETLIKTGQVSWPVLALGGAGALMMLAGVFMLTGKKRQNAR